MKYTLIKRVEESISEKPKSKILLDEFKSVVQASGKADWLEDERGIEVLNPDGSKLNLGPRYGFNLKGDIGSFVLCYEFYEGVAVHSNGRSEVIDFLEAIATELEAKALSV